VPPYLKEKEIRKETARWAAFQGKGSLRGQIGMPQIPTAFDKRHYHMCFSAWIYWGWVAFGILPVVAMFCHRTGRPSGIS
jgi:hypothetical protein